MDADQLLAIEARESHRLTQRLSSQRATAKALRDRAIIRLHSEHHWSYGRIAREVGCSAELVAYTINPPKKRPGKSSRKDLTDRKTG